MNFERALVAWISYGFPESDFWLQTPKLYQIHVEAAQINQIRDHNARAKQALQTAYWAIACYVGKPPKESEIYIDPFKVAKPKDPALEMAKLRHEMKLLASRCETKTWEEWLQEHR